MGVLIRNGTIVTAEGRRHADVLCRDGSIARIAPGIAPDPSDEIVDASDQLVLPGGIDPHVHMELPVAGTVSSDDFESGTAAALAGGTTTVIDFVHPERGESLIEALTARREVAAKAVADYGLHMAVTWWGEATAEEMGRCIDMGVPSFKIYLAYKETVGLDDRDLIRVFATAAELGGLILAHAEHGDMVEHLRDALAEAGQLTPAAHPRSRPPVVEGEATARAAMMAGLTGASLYVVHVTCLPAVEALSAARERGYRVSGETCPQYLLLDDSVYEKPDFEGAAYVIAPPIRPAEHREVLWKALAGGELEIVATDHCPFNLAGQKDLGRRDFRRIPGGAAGVEHRLSLLWTHGVRGGRFDEQRFVDLVSTTPAKRFGLYPRKGAIVEGADADLVVWDPAGTATISARTHHHRCDRSIYEGFEVTGIPTSVVAAGHVRYAGGELRVERGVGRFLSRRFP